MNPRISHSSWCSSLLWCLLLGARAQGCWWWAVCVKSRKLASIIFCGWLQSYRWYYEPICYPLILWWCSVLDVVFWRRIILEAWNGVAQNDGNMLKKPCLKHNSLYGKNIVWKLIKLDGWRQGVVSFWVSAFFQVLLRLVFRIWTPKNGQQKNPVLGWWKSQSNSIRIDDDMSIKTIADGAPLGSEKW